MVTLNEKKIAFDVEYIDLKNKPEWFAEMSPLGKVPTLEVTRDNGEKVVLFESVVINEYLDEVTAGSMLPSEPLMKARARAWIVFADELLGDVFKLTAAKDDQELAEVLDKLDTKLDRLEREIEGPLFLGHEPSLVDAAFVPALQRLAWCNELHPPIASFETRPKVERWWVALAQRKSVQASAVDDLRARFDKMIARDRGGYQSLIGARVNA